ncbi:MAG: spermidine synthase-like protein [bacterium]
MPNARSILISIGFLSAAIIAFQLAIMQILSIVQWYHFAYMVISVALLGFGAAGTCLSIFRNRLLGRFELFFPLSMILCGATMAVVIGISQLSFVRFDSYLLFADYSHVWRLLLTYLIFFIPFFFGALAIGLVFVKFVGQIGKLYFANLLGSGAGGAAALAAMWLFSPQELPAIISILPVISGIMVMPRKSRSLLIAVALSVVIITLGITHPPRLILSEFKSLTKTLNLPEAKITLARSSPHGLLQLVSSPALRFAPGLSLIYQNTVPAKKALFNNGDWFGSLISWKGADLMDYTTSALPFALGDRSKVLVLDAGTGMDVAHAVGEGAKEITAVEPNSVLISILLNELAGEIDSLFTHPSVTIHNVASRTHVLADTSGYDLILLPTVGAFGGTSGLYALQEQYMLTREAFVELWQRLRENGVISITCWLDYPVRNSLRILATLVEALKEQGIDKRSDHIAAVRSWGTITFLVKRSPLSMQEIQQIRSFCEQMLFDPALLPGIEQEEREQFNKLQDGRLLGYLDEILSAEEMDLYSDYDFNIKPATDERPYFSQFIRWKSLPHLSGLFGSQSVPFFEIGYLIVALTMVQISLAAIVLIILPLFRIGWKGGNKTWTVLYFTGIGLGYMFVEIVFIQRFILYFGSPIYSAAAMISSMLICSGIGSYLSAKLALVGKGLLAVLTVIILLLVLYATALTPILKATIVWPFGAKLLFAFLIVAPLSFFMGFPFPVGIRMLAEKNENEVPWAWGINGCVSVISAVLAMIVAVELGFLWVMVFAALAYGLPLGVNWRDLAGL